MVLSIADISIYVTDKTATFHSTGSGENVSLVIKQDDQLLLYHALINFPLILYSLSPNTKYVASWSSDGKLLFQTKFKTLESINELPLDDFNKNPMAEGHDSLFKYLCVVQ